MTISEGKAKDKILLYAIEHEENGFVAASELAKKVFGDGLNIDEVTLLIKKISNSRDEIATTQFGELNSYICATGLTQRFLDQGGYEQLEIEEQAEVEEQKQHQNIQIELAQTTIEANRLNTRNSKFNRFTTIINILIGLINVGLLLYQLFR
ncbi:MAG: hypothetical protein ABJG41_16885 [Cyclobacteriaceae bacterium]